MGGVPGLVGGRDVAERKAIETLVASIVRLSRINRHQDGPAEDPNGNEHANEHAEEAEEDVSIDGAVAVKHDLGVGPPQRQRPAEERGRERRCSLAVAAGWWCEVNLTDCVETMGYGFAGHAPLVGRDECSRLVDRPGAAPDDGEGEDEGASDGRVEDEGRDEGLSGGVDSLLAGDWGAARDKGKGEISVAQPSASLPVLT
jgi:hypothetical protein